MKKPVPNSEDLVEILVRAGNENPEDAFTTSEIQSITGWSKDRIRRVLAAAISKGLVEPVSVWRIGIDRRPHRLPAYRVVRRK